MPIRVLPRVGQAYDTGAASIPPKPEKPGAIEITKPETGGLEALARQASMRPYAFTGADWTDIANKAYTAGDPSNWFQEEYVGQRPIHYMPGEGGRAADEIRTNYLMAGVPMSVEMADKVAIGERGAEVNRLMRKIQTVAPKDYQRIIRAWEELKNKLSS